MTRFIPPSHVRPSQHNQLRDELAKLWAQSGEEIDEIRLRIFANLSKQHQLEIVEQLRSEINAKGLSVSTADAMPAKAIELYQPSNRV